MNKDIFDWLKYHNQQPKRVLRQIPVSPNFIKAGDVLLVSYPDDYEYRLILVVGSKYGSGVYSSTRGNFLMTGFKLTSSKVINKLVLDRFYKNRLANYQDFKAVLGSLFGLLTYRTYDLSKIKELFQVQLNINNIIIEDDE